MRQHSGTLEQKWNRQLTRPIFPRGAKNAVWKRDYPSSSSNHKSRVSTSNSKHNFYQSNGDIEAITLAIKVSADS